MNNSGLYKGRWEIGYYYDDLAITVEALDSDDGWSRKFSITAKVDMSYLGDLVRVITDQIDKHYP